MNITLITELQSNVCDDEYPTVISIAWKYVLIISIITLIIVNTLTYVMKNMKSSNFLDQTGSDKRMAFCPEINRRSVVYPYYVYTIQNARAYQEDRYCTVGSFNGDENTSFYAIFDGHGGARCSQFCANYLYSSIETSINTSPYKDDAEKRSRSRSNSARRGEKKQTTGFLREMDIVNGFQLCDAQYRRTGTRDGTTVISVFINKQHNQIITAHAGDSRAIMITTTESYDLTADHKPSNLREKERIELLGGQIITVGVPRVQGILAVSRSLGDFSLRPYVSNVPTVSYYELTGKECFLVMASDGLWDVMCHDDVAMLLQSYVAQKKTMKECARMLVEYAVQRHSMDNITVMVIDLRSPDCVFGREGSFVKYKLGEDDIFDEVEADELDDLEEEGEEEEEENEGGNSPIDQDCSPFSDPLEED